MAGETKVVSQVTNQEYWQGFMEAPASDTFKWIDGNGIEHMTTLRAWNGGNLYKAISEFEKNVIETGGRSAAPQQAPKPVTGGSEPKKGDSTSENEMTIEKIKVTPETGRVIVDLFGTGHKYADIKAFFNNSTEAAAAFASVTGLDFSEPGEYTLSCIAMYRLSEKLNSKGNPYKNLVSVREA